MGIVGQQINAKFSLAVGDNFYDSGIRTDVHDQRFQSTFEKVFVQPHLQGPDFKFHVIAGNHDHGGNVTAQIEYTKMSNRWNYPVPWSVPHFNKNIQRTLFPSALFLDFMSSLNILL